MHARVTTRQIQPGQMDEAMRIYRDVVVPAGAERQGNKGGLVLTDRSTGKLMTISLWDTEADLRASGPSGATDAISTGPPVREIYEVSLQSVSP